MGFGIVVALGVMANVGVAIEDTRGMSDDEVAVITRRLVVALDDRAGGAVADSAEPCERADRCLDDRRRRTAARVLVLVRLIGVPTRIRIIAERIDADGTPRSVALDLARNRTTWPSSFQRIAAELFPERLAPPRVARASPTEIAKPPPEPEGPSVAPWIAAGVGAAALVTGIAFGVSSQGARSDAASMPTTPEQLDGLERRAIDHGIVANVAFSAALVAGVTGLVLHALE